MKRPLSILEFNREEPETADEHRALRRRVTLIFADCADEA
jgi:hypothetical protein